MTTERTATDRRVLLIEAFARQFEASGQPRIAGRILGFVLTSAEPRHSLTGLATALGVSKASVSTNARRLVAKQLLAVEPVEGSREAHYVVVPDGSRRALTEAATAALSVAALAQDALQLNPESITPGVVALRCMRDTYLDVHDLLSQRVAVSQGSPRW